ncbi:MAG: ATP-binding protein [Candidatus Binatia bacterium]
MNMNPEKNVMAGTAKQSLSGKTEITSSLPAPGKDTVPSPSQTASANTTAQADALRRQAEERLRSAHGDLQRMSDTQMKRLVHELQVAQIELQVQNEELQQAQAQLAAARDRYQDLYDFAPVGYVTLTPDGVILEANLTATRLLETDRARLINANLLRFIAVETRDSFFRHLQRLRTGSLSSTCELSRSRSDGTQVILQLDSAAPADAEGSPGQYRTVLSDVTARTAAETTRQRLVRQLVEVEEAERHHLARELHDEIMQTLTAIKLNLGAVAQALSPVPPQLDESSDMVEDLVEQVRTLSLDLRPPMLDDLGLVPALQWYCERQARRLALPINFAAMPFPTSPGSVAEITCFRVTQEALTNVAKHAQATLVSVEVALRNGTIYLIVRDNGVGFDVARIRGFATHGGGIGVPGMVERVEMVGGSIDIISAPGRGTEIRACIPSNPAATLPAAVFSTNDRIASAGQDHGEEE